MEVPEKAKGGFHAAFLMLAVIMGTYNGRRTGVKNRFLSSFYWLIAGVEVGCIFDHIKEGHDAHSKTSPVR